MIISNDVKQLAEMVKADDGITGTFSFLTLCDVTVESGVVVSLAVNRKYTMILDGGSITWMDTSASEGDDR